MLALCYHAPSLRTALMCNHRSDGLILFRAYTPDDYPMICSWWDSHAWPRVAEDFLPEFGVVVESDETPVAACWLYKTDSKLSWLEWMVSNPDFTDKPTRSDCINKLIDFVVGHAENLGFKAVFTSVKSKPFISRLKRMGFMVADDEMSNMVRVI